MTMSLKVRSPGGNRPAILYLLRSLGYDVSPLAFGRTGHGTLPSPACRREPKDLNIAFAAPRSNMFSALQWGILRTTWKALSTHCQQLSDISLRPSATM
jgi:hypothetical protein